MTTTATTKTTKRRTKTCSAKARTAYLGLWKKNDERPSRPASIKLFVGKRVGMTPKGASSVYGGLKDMTREAIVAMDAK